MHNWRKRLTDSFPSFVDNITALVDQDGVRIGEAEIPNRPGVYMFLHEGEIIYVGEAKKGSGGLRDRIMSKHVSGADTHTLQKYFMNEYPDRQERRQHIKRDIHVRWVVIENTEIVSIVEQLAIWLFTPSLNVA